MKVDRWRLTLAIGLILIGCGAALTAFGTQYMSKRSVPSEACGLGDGCLPSATLVGANPSYFVAGLSLLVGGVVVSTLSKVKVTFSWRSSSQLVSRHSLRVAFGLLAVVGGILSAYLLLTSEYLCNPSGSGCYWLGPSWAVYPSIFVMVVGVIGFVCARPSTVVINRHATEGSA